MPPWSDLAVLFGIILGTAWWTARLRRRGVRGGRYAAAATVGFLGLTLVVTMAAHCIDVISRLAIARGPALRAILAALALVVPLIPIHGFFAIPLGAIAGVALLLVLWRIHPAARPAETGVAVAAIRG